MERNCTLGELRLKDINRKVKVIGWVSKIRNLGSLCFIDLRDRYGTTQINVDPKSFDTHLIHSEYLLQIEGTVTKRDEANPHLETGEIEISAENLKIINKSELPPFIIADKTDALEDTRLVKRYLDLRRPLLQHNLMLRHKILKAARDFLEDKDFLEIETPTLVKSTPEGARDYLVPSRTKKGMFYALPQSPQIYKQLLMIAGMDRYYQIARCYRDEDLRADRQPEFTQIDCEMSFVNREDVLNVIENLVHKIFKDSINYDLMPFKRISYMDAINKYGSDKPDMRFELLIQDFTSDLSDTEFKAFKDKQIHGLIIKNFADKVSRKVQDKDNELVKKFKLPAVSFFKVEDNKLTSSLAKFYKEDTLEAFKNKYNLENNDLVIVGASDNYEVLGRGLGALRLEYGEKLNLIDKNIYVPLFVLDWPLFEKTEQGYESLSNPFTRPRDEDLKYLDTDPCKVLSYAYDTVINGMEISSGALRIYDGHLQAKVFEILGLSNQDIKNRFGFFVDAFNYGTPMHGGFALGVERLSMLICKTDNVKDVVAFPKNLQAYDMMSDCPSTVPTENLDILGIEVKKE